MNYKVNAVVSLGGENFVVYTIDPDGKIITNFSGQQVRLGHRRILQAAAGQDGHEPGGYRRDSRWSQVQPLSSRCSVFMKSDCTHKLNKGEATKGDIVLSLSDVMATKVVDFLKRARITGGKVLLSGA